MASLRESPETGMPPKLDKDAPSLRINVVVSETLIHRLDEWRSKRRPIPNKSEAARLLLEIALASEEKLEKGRT